MSKTNQPLKYLFEAEYSDGSIFKQTPDDKSKIDPEKRSQFYDVLQSKKKIRRFSLVGKSDDTFNNRLTVDLKSGLFYVNGLRVLLESDKLPTLPDHFDLIFYRQWTQSVQLTYDKKTAHVVNQRPGESFCEYFIGWQCNIKGKNYQQKIAVC